MAKTGEKMRIVTINERALTPDELIEKIKAGNVLSKLEFNDFKSYVRCVFFSFFNIFIRYYFF